MSFQNYTSNIPFATHNPSSDQPIMLQNNNSNQILWEQDHFGFNDDLGGTHKQARISTQAAIPGGLEADQGTLYTKLGTEADLYYTPGVSGLQYQLTATNTANFATFGVNALNYGVGIPAGFFRNGGWTFLPGGLIMQYGSYGKLGALGASGTVPFPRPFLTGVFSLQITIIRTGGSAEIAVDTTGIFSLTDFKFYSDSAGSDGIYWIAIGK